MLALSSAAAMAGPAQVAQPPQFPATQSNPHGSYEIFSRLQFPTAHPAPPEVETGTHATQPPVSDEEPESISRGTEP